MKILLALALLNLAFGAQDKFPDVVTPRSMAKREIRKPETPPPGKHIDLYGDGKVTLYIPPNWKPSSQLAITIHYHGAAWFAVDEHRRRGLKEPLVAVYLGEGSAVYQRGFQSPDSWPTLLSHVMAELGAPDDATYTRVDVTSYSAGYGAVRELLKQEDPPKIIRRIILADSMYAGFTSPTDQTPLKDQIEPYVEFAQAAMRGEKGFVVTYSQVPTETYANSASCAQALVRMLGLSFRKPQQPKQVLDQMYPDYLLLETVTRGGLHIWGYAGTDAQAHMTHPRHIADVWRAVWGD